MIQLRMLTLLLSVCILTGINLARAQEPTDAAIKAFEWNGRPIQTFDDIYYALGELTSPEEGQEFMRRYRAIEPRATTNVYALANCYDVRKATLIRKYTGVAAVVLLMDGLNHLIRIAQFGSHTPSILLAEHTIESGIPNLLENVLNNHSLSNKEILEIFKNLGEGKGEFEPIHQLLKAKEDVRLSNGIVINRYNLIISSIRSSLNTIIEMTALPIKPFELLVERSQPRVPTEAIEDFTQEKNFQARILRAVKFVGQR